MTETDRIVEQLQRAYDGDAWHGPSVRSALEGVDSRMATARPLAAGHTICEIVLHLTSWTREVARRVRTGVAREPELGDWPSQVPAGEAEWTDIVARLDAATRAREGEPVELEVDMAKAHVFDPATGANLTHPVRAN